MPLGARDSWTVVMLTTEGLILATSEATSGVPGRRGGEAKGAGVAGITSLAGTADASAPFGGCAVCALAVGLRWHPAKSASGRTKTGRTREGLDDDRICPREQPGA